MIQELICCGIRLLVEKDEKGENLEVEKEIKERISVLDVDAYPSNGR